ncbi:hypothetical protein ACWT_7269 [Actinoplanes sp. SE50]|uniref:hypothetical protein n=1 Tax=unclassified Actinoplanes TaxID=2626549 RepID=UPI00023EDF4F|nr:MULTISPECIES: hypothetical protein [unclassified Actinoplanes]AEV88279.1 hypothetical protein ACPL_7399 [Actinoplanes sp. SE50/110]ATO86684.1 hypothetical protein ACWT_7269 [Actinoplanes sp. SE50]SLM04102.1 hypothetical protein ACSP50_7404 [Actinoplanes sp. SE50/110]
MREPSFDKLRSDVGDAVRQPDFTTVQHRAGRMGRRRHARRWAVTGAAVIAVTGAVLAMPGLGDDRNGAAYASWTASPETLSAGDVQAISRGCVAKIDPLFGYTTAQLAAARKIVSERRGRYGFLSIVTHDWVTTCFRDSTGTVRSPSNMGRPVSDEALGRTGIELQGWGELQAGEGYILIMAGHLGTDVTAVDVNVPDGRTVHATVDDHYFLAWLPQKAGDGAGITFTMTLTDGTTIKDISARKLTDKMGTGELADSSGPS